jgi:hypothetical protein
MPCLLASSPSLNALRVRLIPILLLAAGVFNAKALYAQSTQPPEILVAASAGISKLAKGSPLPDAPEPARENVEATSEKQAMPTPYGTPGTSVESFPTFRQRERHFLFDLVGPAAFIAPAFQAGIDTVRPLKVGYPSDGFVAQGNHPAHGDVPEWGEGAQGYAKRYADHFGQGLIGTTSRYILGEALREDVTYHRCQCTGLLPRSAHAFVGAYTGHTRSGRAIPSLPAIASPFIASEVAVAAWYPDRYRTSDALRISVLSYVAAPFRNLFAEFVIR